MADKLDLGGQAVIEGVMMRSPRSFAVVCRRADGVIVVKEDVWRPIWGKLRFLRWPVMRGALVLFESLINGINALSFSADVQAASQQNDAPKAASGPPTQGAASAVAKWGMFALSIAFGLALFVGAPHLASWGLGTVFGFSASSFAFHMVDGVIKVVILVGYLAAISLLPDIRRVFQYHGAEHKAIFTFERALPLTIENARGQTRFHPRCGTSFLLIVILVSVVIFAATLRTPMAERVVVDHLLKIMLKIPLMFPVAGLAYELLKLSGRHRDSGLVRVAIAPGLWLQRITTREPTNDQLEIALISVRKTLWRERSDTAAAGGVETYASASELAHLPLG